MNAVLAAALAIGLAVLACASSGGHAPTDTSDAGPAPFGSGSVPGFPEDASLGVQVRFVFGGCGGGPEAACHAPGRAVSGLTLPDTTPSNIVNVPSTEAPALMRIRPGDPERSYLYLKITGAPGIDGGLMPKDSPPLDPQSIRAVAAWIEAGAP